MRTFVVTRAANGSWHATSPSGGLRPISGWDDIVRARADWSAVEEWSDDLRSRFIDQHGPERRPDSGPSATSWRL